MDKNEVILSKNVSYRRVSLRKELVDDIGRFVESHPLYRSIPDFIAEAIRLRFEELNYQPFLNIPKVEASTVG